MKTLITVKKIRKSSESARIGTACKTSGAAVTASVVVFNGRLHYRMTDVYGAVNPNFDSYNCRFTPSIQAAVRASKHATGTVICTNRGIYCDIVAMKHLLKDHFVSPTTSRGRVHDVGDSEALDTLLQQCDNVGIGFDNAIGQLGPDDLQEITPARLLYKRNVPTEKKRAIKAESTEKINSKTDSTTTPTPTPSSEAAKVDTEELSAEAVISSLVSGTPAVSSDALSTLISTICAGKRLSITLTVSLN